MIDQAKIKNAMLQIIEALGEDVQREGLSGTPRRVAEMYAEVFSGLYEDAASNLDVTFQEGQDDLVLVKDIPLYSMCEHHFLPFIGQAHVAYIPAQGRVTGLSKIARVVEILARRPQVQERLTAQIADILMQNLKPRGVCVVLEAEHLCMTMRGIKKPGSRAVTSAMRGIFRTDERTRQEVLTLIATKP